MAGDKGMMDLIEGNRNPFYREPGAPNPMDAWLMQLLGPRSPIDRRGADFGVPPPPPMPGFWDMVLERLMPRRPALREPGPAPGSQPAQLWRRG